MRMKRFPAKTIPQALAEVQRTLGPDAVLLETRQISDPERRKRGELVEILAAIDPQVRPRKASVPEERDRLARPSVQSTPEDRVGATIAPSFDTVLDQAPVVPPLPSAAADALIALQEAVAALQVEVSAIRQESQRPQPPTGHNELIVVTASLVDLGKKVDDLIASSAQRSRTLPPAAWQAAVATTLVDALETCGLDGLAARHWGRRLNADLAEHPWRSGETPVARLAELMGGELRCAPRIESGEIHVVLGGSGAGKSSLVVKLALRERLLHGRTPLLVSLDHVRPEGVALLRRYAEVFGLPLHRVSSAAELAAVLERQGRGRTCFIDAPAIVTEPDASPQTAELWRMVAERGVCHLLLPAATGLPEMRRQIAAHAPLGIDRLAFSKIDEASHFGQVVAIATEFDLPVSWLTNGRQIPEDLVDASRDLLATLMTRRGESPTAASVSPLAGEDVVYGDLDAGSPVDAPGCSLRLPIPTTA